MIALAVFTTNTVTAQNTIPYLVSENRQLKRDGVKLFLLIEQMEEELAIVKANVDSCNNLIYEYQYELNRCKNIYSNYAKLVEQKNVVLALDEQQIKIMKRQAKLLRTKLLATGIALPVAAGGAGVAVTFLIMSLKK